MHNDRLCPDRGIWGAFNAWEGGRKIALAVREKRGEDLSEPQWCGCGKRATRKVWDAKGRCWAGKCSVHAKGEMR